jgi:hypothetical protein
MAIVFFLLFTPQQHIDEHRKIEKKRAGRKNKHKA